jgi:hypothetical protein
LGAREFQDRIFSKFKTKSSNRNFTTTRNAANNRGLDVTEPYDQAELPGQDTYPVNRCGQCKLWFEPQNDETGFVDAELSVKWKKLDTNAESAAMV